jgi:hypothetical protein
LDKDSILPEILRSRGYIGSLVYDSQLPLFRQCKQNISFSNSHSAESPARDIDIGSCLARSDDVLQGLLVGMIKIINSHFDSPCSSTC